MSYLFATDIVIEAKRPKPDARVMGWLTEQPLASVYLSALTLGELQESITSLRGTDEARALQGWLEQLRKGFAGRILDVTPDVAVTWGRLRAEARKQSRTAVAIDLLLVATAATHNLTLVTSNAVGIEGLSVDVFNPRA